MSASTTNPPDLPRDKAVSARTIRRRKQKQREAAKHPAAGPPGGDGCPIKFAVRADGSVEWLRGSDWRWIDRICAEGKTVAEICDLIGVPRHPTCHDIVYADGSVPETEPNPASQIQ